jgi:RNA recognition motif-containing protein
MTGLRSRGIRAMRTLVILDRLPREITEPEVRRLLEPFGDIRSVRIVRDASGYSLAFAHIEVTNPEAAYTARKKLHGTELNGEVIRVAIILHGRSVAPALWH